jgi:hypothetical protein
MTLPIQDEYAGLEISNSANTSSVILNGRRSVCTAMTSPKPEKNHGAGVMPNTARSRSSYPQVPAIKTLDLFPEFVNI